MHPSWAGSLWVIVPCTVVTTHRSWTAPASVAWTLTVKVDVTSAPAHFTIPLTVTDPWYAAPVRISVSTKSFLWRSTSLVSQGTLRHVGVDRQPAVWFSPWKFENPTWAVACR